MQNILEKSKNDKESLEFKLQELEEEKKSLDVERNQKKLLDPEKEKRAK
jgi:hypothetical protein